MITIKQAINLLKDGKCVIHPSESIYGFCADARLASAAEHIYNLKQRPTHMSFLVICSLLDMIEPWVILSDEQRQTILSCTHPTTWITHATEQAPTHLLHHNTLAFRVTRHPESLLLCEGLGSPLISTSANISGTTYNESSIREHFPDTPILEGDLGGHARPSRIIDLITGKCLRD